MGRTTCSVNEALGVAVEENQNQGDNAPLKTSFFMVEHSKDTVRLLQLYKLTIDTEKRQNCTELKAKATGELQK